jgi:hypothetical protein
MSFTEGHQKIGGREAGTPNKRTVARRKRSRETIAKIKSVLPGAPIADAHALMVATYLNEELDLYDRLAAARVAIQYEKPRLNSNNVNLKAEMSESFVQLWHAISSGDIADVASRLDQQQKQSAPIRAGGSES